ncbi:MAG: tetratricopeptide repeat protein [Nitrospinota bacterium]
MINENLQDYFIRAYTKTIKRNPDSFVFMPLANAYKKRGMLDEAMRTIRRGLRIYPHYTSAKALSGELLFLLGKFDEAEIELRAVAKRSKEHILSRKLLVEIYQKLNLPHEALIFVDDLIKICPPPYCSEYQKTKKILLQKVGGQVPLKPEEGQPLSAEVSPRTTRKLQRLEKLYMGIQSHSALRKDVLHHKVPTPRKVDWAAFQECKAPKKRRPGKNESNGSYKDKQLEVFERMLLNLKKFPGGSS